MAALADVKLPITYVGTALSGLLRKADRYTLR